jgi:hypothetical protein
MAKSAFSLPVLSAVALLCLGTLGNCESAAKGRPDFGPPYFCTMICMLEKPDCEPPEVCLALFDLGCWVANRVVYSSRWSATMFVTEIES